MMESFVPLSQMKAPASLPKLKSAHGDRTPIGSYIYPLRGGWDTWHNGENNAWQQIGHTTNVPSWMTSNDLVTLEEGLCGSGILGVQPTDWMHPNNFHDEGGFV